MEEDTQVAIKIGKKTVKILKGKKAEIALKAVQLVLKSHKKIKIDIIDTSLPKNFSYARALIEALESDLENPIEIAEYVLKKLKKAKISS